MAELIGDIDANAESRSDLVKKRLDELCTERDRSSPDDQLSSIMAMIDLPDHVIDLRAHIMGIALSTDQRYEFLFCSDRCFHC
uniref:Uncharacterized protein n=1 Tax=Parascaris equorum TaxID=6256 RepID=A0A914R5K4_PAREQ